MLGVSFGRDHIGPEAIKDGDDDAIRSWLSIILHHVEEFQLETMVPSLS
jgi:hypothetical protein